MNKKKLLVILAVLILVCASIVYVALQDEAGDKQPEQPQQNTETTQETPTTTNPSSFDKTKYSTNDVTSIWVVVNKQRPLNPKDYAPTDLVALDGGQRMRKEAANALTKLVN